MRRRLTKASGFQVLKPLGQLIAVQIFSLMMLQQVRFNPVYRSGHHGRVRPTFFEPRNHHHKSRTDSILPRKNRHLRIKRNLTIHQIPPEPLNAHLHKHPLWTPPFPHLLHPILR